MCGCSLFTSFDGISGAPDETDASTDDATTSTQADGKASAPVVDASDAGVDSGHFRVPAEGVYTYAVTGLETSDAGPVFGPEAGALVLTHTSGPTGDGMVHHLPFLDGGALGALSWSIRLDVNKVHWREMQNQSAFSGDIAQLYGSEFIRFSFFSANFDTLVAFSCLPGDTMMSDQDKPGDVGKHACNGKDVPDGSPFAVQGTYTMVGTDAVSIAGVNVLASHYQGVYQVFQAQNGTETIDFWFAQDDGMLLKITYDVHLTTHSPFTATYAETTTMTLTSRTPSPFPDDAGTDAAADAKLDAADGGG
jgi:hypothetical protein